MILGKTIKTKFKNFQVWPSRFLPPFGLLEEQPIANSEKVQMESLGGGDVKEGMEIFHKWRKLP